jgi:hypothetical protein
MKQIKTIFLVVIGIVVVVLITTAVVASAISPSDDPSSCPSWRPASSCIKDGGGDPGRPGERPAENDHAPLRKAP